MSGAATLPPEVAIALGIASTAMPFARTPEAEAERWLRILRAHGEAGMTLQALGVSEGRLAPPAGSAESAQLATPAGQGPSSRDVEWARHGKSSGHDQVEHGDPDEHGDPVERVIDEAAKIAARRAAPGVATTDLLLAVMCVYGDDFDRVLRAHGTDCEALVEQLGIGLSVDQVCGED